MTPRAAFDESPDPVGVNDDAQGVPGAPGALSRPGPLPRADGAATSNFQRRAAPQPNVIGGDNGLGDFASESSPHRSGAETRERSEMLAPSPYRPFAVLAVVVAGAIVAAAAVWLVRGRVASAPQQGQLTLDTRPSGVAVTIDGRSRGTTPLSLALAPGTHSVVLSREGVERRTMTVQIAGGHELAQYLEMTPSGPPAATTGSIAVTTDPPGARVSVDGRASGVSPARIPDLSPAEHVVTVSSATGSAERRVVVERGGTTSVVFQLPRTSAPVGGWITVSSPFDVQILEGQDVVGTSGASRIMLSAGRHELRFVNEALGYADTRRIDVAPGRMSSIKVDPPKGTLSVNARPWAEVFIDGQDVGQTPLGAVAVPIGSHKIVFRNPQSGERQLTTVVTVKGPNRIGVDYSKP